MKKAKDIDSYIAGFPESTCEKLQQVREIIKRTAPDASEVISYGIPTFKMKKNLVHFAGYERHIGFYPGADGIAHFKEELKDYKHAKGSVQFPLDKSMPLNLIERIVRYRVEQALK